MKDPKPPNDHADQDVAKHRDEVIRHMLNTPPQPRVNPKPKEGESKKRGRPAKPKT